MKLFRRKDRREQSDRSLAVTADNDADVADKDTDSSEWVIDVTDSADLGIHEISTVVEASHTELDLIEGRLVELRQQGEQLIELDVADRSKPSGSVEMLNLSDLMSLREEDEDDDFGKRFKEFANADITSHERGWLDQS